MLLRCHLGFMVGLLIASPAFAQLEVTVLGADGKAAESEMVEMQDKLGRGEPLARSRTDKNGKCTLNCPHSLPAHVYVIVRTSAKSWHAPFAREYELKKILKDGKGVIEIRLKLSRV